MFYDDKFPKVRYTLARVHGPCWSPVYPTRPVDTAVIFDTRVHGTWTWIVCTELKSHVTASNRFGTFLRMLSLKLLNPITTNTLFISSSQLNSSNTSSSHLHTTVQPSYLQNLITVQPPRSTCSSSLVTLTRPPTSWSLRVTDRSF